jgi:hypothetical protein
MGTFITFIVSLAIAALYAACARRISRWRPRPFRESAADPFSSPIGDVPTMPAQRCLTESGTGYTARELSQFTSAGRAAPADQGSGGDGASSQGAAAARPINGRGRRAF